MNDGKKKLGRKFKDDSDDKMKMISFKVDRETWDVLQELEAAEGREVTGKRSTVLRRLILNAKRGA